MNFLKLQRLCVFTALFFTTTFMFAQIKVFPNGFTKIGIELPHTTSPTSFDEDNLMAASILGNQVGDNSGYSGGARLSFGDVGHALTGVNVFIGEYYDPNMVYNSGNPNGIWDSDAMQLHGKNGIHFTAGLAIGTQAQVGSTWSSANKEIAYLDTYGNFRIGGNLTTLSSFTPSDSTLKKNILPLSIGLAFVQKINCVTYNYKTNADEDYLAALSKIKPTVDKEIKNLEKTKKELTERINNPDNHIGLIAQDVQKTLPQLVKTDAITGKLALNYTELIPVLIQAIKEQQVLIDAQAKDIAAIKKKLGL